MIFYDFHLQNAFLKKVVRSCLIASKNSNEDKTRENHSVTVTTLNHIDAFSLMIEDRQVTWSGIHANCGIDITIIQTFVDNHLRLKKGCYHWILNRGIKNNKKFTTVSKTLNLLLP